jgi:beta-galactosidase
LAQVQTYVWWRGLQPKNNSQWDEIFNFNLTMYLEKAQAAGLFVNLRIGPYICAETSYG